MFNPSDMPEGGFADVGNASFEDMPQQLLKLFTQVDSLVTKISKTWESTAKSIEKTSGIVSKGTPGSGALGLGSFTYGQAATSLGLGIVAGAAVVSSMAPTTAAAVTQALTASTYAGYAGMSNMQATRLANSQVGMGATSAMGPTMAAATLSSMGILAGGTSSNNVMSQLGGLSAMTGMTNQQAAQGMAAANGMLFLRAGATIRDSKGNLLPPNQIVNNVWNALTRGRSYTQQQVAATFLSPNGAGYQSLQAITGGDPNLMQILQDGFMARAKAGSPLTAGQMGNAQTMLSTMGVDKSSPLYSNFANNTAQAKLLGATEQGLVGGYDTATNVNASATNSLANVATAADGVTKALMGLKGFLETMPGTGSVGGTASALGGAALTMLGNRYASKSASNSLIKILEQQGLLKTAVATKGPSLLGRLFSGAKSLLGNPKNLLKLLGVGAEQLGVGAEEVLSDGLATPAVVGEETGIAAQIASMFPGGLKGPRGGGFDHGDMGHGGIGGPTGGKNILPVSKGTPVTSPYGPRGGGAKTKGFHAGIDYGVQTGSNVYAHDDGVVTTIGNGGGYGNYIEINHGAYRTRYAHLSSIMVSRGQKVSGGQVIAKSGATGNVTGPHLHFEVLVNGKKVNPAPYLMGAGTSNAVTGMTNTSSRNNQNSIVDMGSLSSTDVNSVLNSLSTNGSSYQDLSSLFGSTGAKNLTGNSSLSFIKGQLQTTAGVILGTGSQQEWARTLLGKLKVPITPDNVKALTTWAAWEGGQWHNSAHYNPLNTTQGAAGATNMNKEGVKSYTSWAQGYSATLQTLNNGRYKAILSALRQGNNTAGVLKAVDHSPWGTHIPGYGGPGAEIGTAGIPASLHMPTLGRGGTITGSGGGTTNVNFNVRFYAQQASVADAKRFIKMIEAEAKNSALLRTIGSVG